MTAALAEVLALERRPSEDAAIELECGFFIARRVQMPGDACLGRRCSGGRQGDDGAERIAQHDAARVAAIWWRRSQPGRARVDEPVHRRTTSSVAMCPSQ